MTPYRSGWFYTYASPGQLTNTWTSLYGGTSGTTYVAPGTTLTYVDDAPGDSGYASGDSQNPVTRTEVFLYWMTGSTATGEAIDVGQNAANAEYPTMCNGGGTIA